MSHQETFRRALEEHDVETCWRIWAHVAPNMPQPKSEAEARAIMHHACTQTPIIAFRSRAYSHRWLLDHGLPSGLPDNLRPAAEREYPKVVDAVGIAVASLSDAMAPAVPIVRGAMESVVLEHYADGVRDPEIIKPRMIEARDKAIKKLLG